MPTIADEFIVRLGLDPTSFRAGAEEVERSFTKTKDVASKTGKQMEESNKLLSASFGKVRNELLAFYAALLGGRAMKEFIGDTIEGAAAVGRFAQNIGSTPAQVIGWEQAVERMGGTAQDADKSLDALSKALFDVHNMGEKLPMTLYRLEGNFKNIGGTRFDTEHGIIPFMNDIAAQAKKLAAIDPQGAFRLLTEAGISDSVANTMIKYGSGMSAFVDSIGGANAPTQAAIKAAQDLQDKWAQVRQTVDSIGNRSLPDLDAAIKPFLDDVLAVLNYFKEGDKILAPLRGLRETEKLPQNVHGHADWGAYWEHIKGAVGGAEGAIGRYFEGRERNEATPIPWGDWLRKLGESIIPSAQGAELPQGRASTGLSGEHTLSVHGQELSSSNPLPVDVVRNSIITPGGQENGNYGTPESILGGSGSPLDPFDNSPRGARIPRTLRDRTSGGAGGPYDYRNSPNSGELTKLITAEAQRAGVDPRIMEGIRAGESAHAAKYDIKDDALESSWGPFQLNRRRGLGVQFERETGLDLRDPKTIPAQARWVAEYLKKTGGNTSPWVGFHGPRDADPRWGDSGYIPAAPVSPASATETRKNISDLAAPGTTALGSPDQLNKGFGSGDWTFPAIAPYDKIPAATQPGGQLSPEKSSLLDYGIPSGGARLSSLAAINPVTTSSTSNSMHVVNHIDARGATDPRGIAREIELALERSTSTMMAQSGQV